MADPEPSSPDTDLSLDIAIECPGWSDSVTNPEERCREAVLASIAAVEGVSTQPALSILLSDDETIAALNTQFRDKQGPTNVLSFPAGDVYPDGTEMLGDIAVAHETVEREAEAARVSVGDHLSHMIVHGTLHLLGFDHQVDPEADEMEALETLILKSLGIADPYAEQAS